MGDEVLVKWDYLQGMEGTPKMRPKFGGLYVVKKEVAPGSYELQGPTKGLPHVYHHSQLKPFCRDPANDIDETRCQHPPASKLRVGPKGVHREIERIGKER